MGVTTAPAGTEEDRRPERRTATPVDNGHPQPSNGPLRRTVTVRNPQGLHMRPAMAFAQLANRFQSAVTLRRPGKTANGRSMMQLIMLAALPGTELTLEVEGEDAAAALPVLAAALEAPSADQIPRAT